MTTEGWGKTYDEGTILFIDKDRSSKNGPFTIFSIRDKVTNEIKRIQAWDQAYKDLKNEVYYIGSSVCVPGWVHYFTDKNGCRQVRIKTDTILPQGGKINIRLKVTSDWYKGESVGKDIHAFSGKPISGDENITNSLVVRCYMSRYSVLWRHVTKGNIIDVTGTYNIEEDETGSRIVINNVQDIKEVSNE